jgi:hypothetical protein
MVMSEGDYDLHEGNFTDSNHQSGHPYLIRVTQKQQRWNALSCYCEQTWAIGNIRLLDNIVSGLRGNDTRLLPKCSVGGLLCNLMDVIIVGYKYPTFYTITLIFVYLMVSSA